MDRIHVTFPEGKSIDVRPGTKLDEIAANAGVRKTAIAAKVDGHAVDLSSAIDKDCALEFVLPDSAAGLDVLRHSTAHLMAQAVQGLFPGTQVTIGPTIEDGFYYDFKSERTFSPEDLSLIEQRMHELAKADLKIVREEMPRAQAIELFRVQSQLREVLLRRTRRGAALGASDLCAAHGDRSMKESLRRRHRHQRRDLAAASRLTEHGNVARITPERRDVVLDPSERRDDVEHADVARTRPLLSCVEVGEMQEAE